MQVTPSELLGRLRRPEYTGRNRCTPCTVLNVLLALAGTGAVAAAVSVGTLPVYGALVGGALLVAALAAIYLRGYLVPGTPWLTSTYLPDRILRWFDKGPAVRRGGELNVELVLQRAGAVTDCEAEDDLCLTDPFRTAWRESVIDLRHRDTVRRELAAVFGVDADRMTFHEYGDAFAVSLPDGQRAGQWESRAALLADVAAARELRARYGGWTTMDIGDRGSVLNALRIFLEQCPVCDGSVSLDREAVQSCCRSIDVVAVTCGNCEARIFEVEQFD